MVAAYKTQRIGDAARVGGAVIVQVEVVAGDVAKGIDFTLGGDGATGANRDGVGVIVPLDIIKADIF